MAAPIIDSVTPAGPIQATVGTKVTLTVVGHDPDAKTENITLTLTDPEGNASQPFTVPFQWTDGPLVLKAVTSGASVVAVSGMTVTVQG